MVHKNALDRGPVREFLSVVLGTQLYAVALTQIHEILPPPPLTVVPRAPDHVVGVCSVRGQLVTVVDLKRQLRIAEVEGVRRPRILLARTGGEIIGYLVDEVRQVVRLTDDQVEPAAAALGAEIPEHVVGIGRQGGQVFILLDLANLVSR
jgi:purine-binding chemotaxis protein CheW